MARVDLSRAVAKINAIGNVLHRPLRDVLDSGARVAAISLTKSTEPEGTGSEAQTEGENAVSRDIQLVYGNAGRAYEAIRSRVERTKFWALYKLGAYAEATQIAQENGVNVGPFDGGAAHKAARRSRRPVILRTTKPTIYVIDPRQRRRLDRYVKEVQRDVGTAKGGWADCVRAIGGNPRGLREEGDITANWITRKGHGYGAAYHGGTDEHPTITIQNRIPYVDQVLSQSAKRYALNVAHERSLENLRQRVTAELKNLRSAA
jgi:hypothetical protein